MLVLEIIVRTIAVIIFLSVGVFVFRESVFRYQQSRARRRQSDIVFVDELRTLRSQFVYDWETDGL